MLEGLHRHVAVPDEIHLINSVCREDLVDVDKINVLWQHIPADQPLVMGMRDKFFVRMIDAFVYVSHWQHEKFRYIHQIPLENAVVIKNAIEPIEFTPRETGDKIRLIYTSVPYRGLEVLLSAIDLLDRDDIELDVFSSSVIYGPDFARIEGPRFQHILDRAAETRGVNLRGYAPNHEVRAALQQAHIFAYPCIFEETACLSLIEAGAAGCKMVATNIGGLPESSCEFATLVPIQASEQALVSNYAAALNATIEDCIATRFRGDERQSQFFNAAYAWQRRAPEWERLFYSLIQAT